jgi:prepilin signal peptidase PulO-like enzyme (type II secretory pathway)
VLLWPFLILTAVFGACVGSFLNVVIYRIPAGLSVLNPLWSFCPRCKHQLASHDNVPVLGWLWLRGRCRYCKAPISMQYPMIEAITAVLFALMFFAFYTAPFRDDFAAIGLVETWPVLLVYLFLLAGLIASTVIDAKLFIIPLEIPYAVALVALMALPLTLIWLPAAEAVCPGANGPWFGAGIGGTAGLIVSVALLYFRILPRSFADEPPPPPEVKPSTSKPQGKPAEPPKPPVWQRLLPVILLLLGIALLAMSFWTPMSGLLALIAFVILWWAVIPLSLLDEDRSESDEVDEYLAHPAPRREVSKELLFVAIPSVGAIIGYWVLTLPAFASIQPIAPVRVFGGALLGFLTGAALVWFTRILGTLGFGKEAMGLGDVHLMAAIGAVLGPLPTVIAFFLAPFFGLVYALLDKGLTAVIHRRRTPIPYGPHLAGAAVVVMLFWPLIARGLETYLNLEPGTLVPYETR